MITETILAQGTISSGRFRGRVLVLVHRLVQGAQ
jgi:hypothetical protein